MLHRSEIPVEVVRDGPQVQQGSCDGRPGRLADEGLDRGGNRQATAALYRAVIVRLRWHQPAIDDAERRAAAGLSKRGFTRCLKRYLAREIYHLLPPVTLASSTANRPPTRPREHWTHEASTPWPSRSSPTGRRKD